MTDQNNDKQKIEDMFIPSYMRGYEPFQVTFSGRYAAKPDDGSGRVFVMPFPTFVIATQKLLNDRIIEAKIEELESLWEKVNDTEIGPRYEVDIWRERTYDRISELKAQTVRGEKE